MLVICDEVSDFMPARDEHRTQSSPSPMCCLAFPFGTKWPPRQSSDAAAAESPPCSRLWSDVSHEQSAD